MTIAEFTKRIRDDASRFRADYERTTGKHPGLLESERSLHEWLGLFALYVETDDAVAKLRDGDTRRR